MKILVMQSKYFLFVVSSLLIRSSVAQNFDPDMNGEVGCAGGKKAGLASYTEVHACKGQWSDHVENSGHLCAKSWHVCSRNDSDVLKTISWYDATHTRGCFAINAAHNTGSCGECSPTSADDMAAIGADCPTQNSEEQSCFGRGKIDASCCGSDHHFQACHSTPWITGVLCCKNKIDGAKPVVVKSPKANIVAKVGSSVTLECKTEGDPLPRIYWFKNGEEISTHFSDNTTHFVDNRALTILHSTEKDSGLYQCKAKNKHGVAVSYKSKVRIYNPQPDIVACRDVSQQQIFHGEQFATCGGRWKGHVKKATKQLCAAGWHVCSAKDRQDIIELSWSSLLKIDGCFAYNAASSTFFECSKCSPRRKGNRMAGVGQHCGQVSGSTNSCLSHGRMDMFVSKTQLIKPDSNSTYNANKSLTSDRKARTCNYVSGITDGVLCCKDKARKRHKSKKKRNRATCRAPCLNGGKCIGKNLCKCTSEYSGENCETKLDTCKVPCGPNSYCSTKGACKCNKGYKMDENNICISRDPVKRKNKLKRMKTKLSGLIIPDVVAPGLCGQTNCLNGGVCKFQTCVCPTPFYGKSCELKRWWSGYYLRKFINSIRTG